MSRRGSNVGRRLPLFQMEVVDYSRRNGRGDTIVISNESAQVAYDARLGEKEVVVVDVFGFMPSQEVTISTKAFVYETNTIQGIIDNTLVMKLALRNTYTVAQGAVVKGREKRKIDVLPRVPCRTHIKRFKDSKAAKKWGGRFGTVISCFKVDTSPYLKNIEYLNLHQEPLTIEMDREEYTLGSGLELQRGGRRAKGRNIRIEILDKE